MRKPVIPHMTTLRPSVSMDEARRGGWSLGQEQIATAIHEGGRDMANGERLPQWQPSITKDQVAVLDFALEVVVAGERRDRLLQVEAEDEFVALDGVKGHGRASHLAENLAKVCRRVDAGVGVHLPEAQPEGGERPRPCEHGAPVRQ